MLYLCSSEKPIAVKEVEAKIDFFKRMLELVKMNDEAGAVSQHCTTGAETETRESLKIQKSRVNFNLFNMKNIFVRLVGIVAIAALSFTTYAQPPCSNAGASMPCSVVRFPIGMDANGGEMCADFNIIFICDVNCNITIDESSTITFYECSTKAGALTFPFGGTGTYTAGVHIWSFDIDFVNPIANPWPEIEIIDANGNPIQCDLSAIMLGIPLINNMPSFQGGHPNLENTPDFQSCLSSLQCP